MIFLREAFMGILLLLLLGVGLGASLVALANRSGTAPALRSLGRLNAALLLVEFTLPTFNQITVRRLSLDLRTQNSPCTGPTTGP